MFSYTLFTQGIKKHMASKSSNNNMHKAKRAKNDEFYTQLSDIEKELGHYKDHFKGKSVFLNCDDPTESNFWRYFSMNFEFLELSKLVATHYERDKPSYKLEITADVNGDGKTDNRDMVKTPLKQNGDFRSPECIELLKEADIVVTNPPFSLFREYLTLLMEHNKKFLIIGNMNAITYKETFKFIKENGLWLGVMSPKEFMEPSGNIKKFGNIKWFTNLDTKKRHEELILWKTYKGNEADYPTYDNYDAINVDKVKDIPVDYDGVMGVPITFLDKFNPEQFEIIGFTHRNDPYQMKTKIYKKEDDNKFNDLNGSPIIKVGEEYRFVYMRILIMKVLRK